MQKINIKIIINIQMIQMKIQIKNKMERKIINKKLK